jgi:hypothetical protein
MVTHFRCYYEDLDYDSDGDEWMDENCISLFETYEVVTFKVLSKLRPNISKFLGKGIIFEHEIFDKCNDWSYENIIVRDLELVIGDNIDNEEDIEHEIKNISSYDLDTFMDDKGFLRRDDLMKFDFKNGYAYIVDEGEVNEE